MSRTQARISAAIIIVCFASTLVMAVPPLISYQGQLNDQYGVPVSATVSFIFGIYDVSTGGAALWTEAQTLPVSNGLFNVQLGSVQPLASSLFENSELYLGIRVGADPEMTPRQRITSSAYSQRSELTPPFIPTVSGVLSWYSINPPTSGTNYVLGTVPVGSKWIVTNIEIVHESKLDTTPVHEYVLLNNAYTLGIVTDSSTSRITKRERLSWQLEAGPVLNAGETVSLSINGSSRTAGAFVYYVQVPESYQTKKVITLSSFLYSAGTATIGTVPNGKIWRVISMASHMGNYGDIHYFGILLNDTMALFSGGRDSGDGYGGQFEAISFSYNQAPILTAGQTIKLVSSVIDDVGGFAVVIEE